MSSGTLARSSPRCRYGPYLPDAEHDVVRARDLDRVHVPRVDLLEMVGDERVEALLAVGVPR